jgi:hypothetical protein
VLQAVERRGDVHKLMKDFHTKFAYGAERLDGLGDTTYWHKRHAMWGHFRTWQRDDGTDRYWNSFGLSAVRLRQNIIVEINPPSSGASKTMQGMLAQAEDGSRWILHRGRMSIAGGHIREHEFDAVSSSRRSDVSFSDGTVVACHRVANLYAPAVTLQNQVAAFVRECNRARTHYQDGPEAAEQQAAVEAAELSFPELTGGYQVGAQGPKFGSSTR